ncbi:hypothetical protein EJ110_NYTH10754 [Nymphaea thermarum]|nr:hypothetical protein EJ110_NYTH10754 [Nymphaea thermarum]
MADGSTRVEHVTQPFGWFTFDGNRFDRLFVRRPPLIAAESKGLGSSGKASPTDAGKRRGSFVRRENLPEYKPRRTPLSFQNFPSLPCPRFRHPERFRSSADPCASLGDKGFAERTGGGLFWMH